MPGSGASSARANDDSPAAMAATMGRAAATGVETPGPSFAESAAASGKGGSCGAGVW